MFVVAGVTGNTGKIVAEALLANHKAVRVLVRDAAKGAEWRARGAQVAAVDLDDAVGLTNAMRGAEGAYLLLPPQMKSTDPRADNLKRTRAFVRAIADSNVGHVVLLSSIGAQLSAGTGPILSLHDAETAFSQLKSAVTFVRAGYFMENWGGSLYALGAAKLPTFLKAGRPIAMVATDDIGATAARALLEGPSAKGAHSVIELAGPRDYTPDDVAAALSRITGKAITLEQGPEEAMVPALTGAGLNEPWAKLYQEMTHGLNAGDLVYEGGTARAVRGTTDLAVVLERLVGHTTPAAAQQH